MDTGRLLLGLAMTRIDRRQMILLAATFGASIAFPPRTMARAGRFQESRERFPQGVASADPTDSSVILWTRRAPLEGEAASKLKVQIAEDEGFHNIAAIGRAAISADMDHTCRFLAVGLRPGREYWYRFIDEYGFSSGIGRTFTAPRDEDDEEARFAFVSCQNINLGFSTPFRLMIREDAARPRDERIRFVLHLGDFIYEMIWYPEDRPRMQGRTVRDVVRLPRGEKIGDYHVPTCIDDYRAIYRAYLADPDIQDARARWPFICIWDNHEFTNRGWQSRAVYDRARAAQTLKVAANQAWFEYVPAQVRQPSAGSDLKKFHAPLVEDRPLSDFDDFGLSHEANNLAAVNSLLIARELRWGRHVSLLLTDNRSFRSEPPLDGANGEVFGRSKIPFFVPQDVLETLDGGRSFDNDNPPATISYNGKNIPNPRLAAPTGSMLGSTQKRWFLDRICKSTSTWLLWGNSVGMLDLRCDPTELPADLAAAWPTSGYGVMGAHDWSAYSAERAEILEAAQTAKRRLVSLVGDRHAFYAGTVSASLALHDFKPVAAEFVTGSISTPSVIEAAAPILAKNHPLASLILDRQGEISRPALNITLRHGVKSSLSFGQTGSKQQALALRSPDLAPHLAFADAAGHGYALVRAGRHQMEVTFVGTPAPAEPGDLEPIYRVTHRLEAWAPEKGPAIARVGADGPGLAERFLDWDA